MSAPVAWPCSVAELMALPPCREWGPWRFQLGGLKNVPMDYLIPWRRIQNTDDVLAWIRHMSGKNTDRGGYGGDSMLMHLVHAFDDVLDLDRLTSLSGSAPQRPIDAPALARAYRDRLKNHAEDSA